MCGLAWVDVHRKCRDAAVMSYWDAAKLTPVSRLSTRLRWPKGARVRHIPRDSEIVGLGVESRGAFPAARSQTTRRAEPSRSLLDHDDTRDGQFNASM